MSNTALKVAEFLGLKRNIVILLLAILLIGAGEETWMRFMPKYLQSLEATALIIGLFDGLKTLLGAVYAYPGGVLVDRLGHRRALVAFNALSILGYVLMLLAPHWAAVIGGMFLFLAWSNLSMPATFSLVGSSLASDKHTMGIGVQSLIKRLPILIGPILGGLLIDRYGVIRGIRIGLGISIALGLLAILIQQRIEQEAPGFLDDRENWWAVIQSLNPRLRRLLFSDILIRFCERIPYAWVVIWVMDHVGANAAQFGILTGVEMVVAVACYVPVAHLADRYGREPFVIATFLLFTLFPLSLLMAKSFTLLLVAFAIRGLKEFGEPARKALIISYSRSESRGRTVGAYYLVRDTLVSAGSLIGAGLWKLGPAVNFWSAGALGAAGTLLYVVTFPKRSAE